MKLREKCDRLPVIITLALFTVVVLRCAWLSDDAYITYRTIDNFFAGHGLTWNTGQRVQAFTHPLWMMLLATAYFITGEIHLTGIALSVILSAGAALLYASLLASTPLAATVGMTVFILSKAFVDYSTSGLENPLTHLLLALYLALLFKRPLGGRWLLLLALLGGLITLNRMDLFLIVAPGLLVRWYQHRSFRAVGLLILGFAPFLLWEAFALLYYGSPFPNTAYAKLNTGLPAGVLIKQGLFYFLNSLTTRPLTPIMIAAGLVTPFVIGQRSHIPVSVGVVLYLLYVVRIGGDFMAGRFLTAPLFCAVAVLSRSPAAHSVRALLLTLGFALLIGLTSPRSPLLSGERYGRDFGHMEQHGIADERAFYYQSTGLLRAARGVRVPDHEWARQGRAARAAGQRLLVAPSIGFLGFEAGPAIHIVDEFALADPLLARLPVRAGDDWRIGHFPRSIPEGYLQTLRNGENVIADPEVARLYDALALITRGRLLDPRRLVEIVKLNAGAYRPTPEVNK